MLRIGLIGAGVIGRDHLHTFRHLDGAKLVGVADPLVDRARELAELGSGEAYEDWHALIGQVDLAWICTPPKLHEEQTLELARAGIHVFCEKPITLDVASADRMIDGCRGAGVHLMVGHVIRYYPETIEIKRLLDGGELGDPLFVFAHRLTQSSDLQRGRRDVSTWGGFSVESGIHEADTVRVFGGEVASVYARVAYADPDFPAYDTDYRALLRMRSGGGGQLQESVTAPARDWSWGVVGARASATSPRRGEVRIWRRGEEERTVAVEQVQDKERNVNRSMLAENQAFVDAVRADKTPAIPGEEGRANLALVLAGLRSAREERVVELSA
jgi:predicted dehydrogenase